MKRAIKLLFIWLFVSLVGVFTYSVCYGRLTADKNFDTSENWYSEYSVVFLNKNKRLLKPNLTPSEVKEIKDNAIQGLIKAPLSYLPFVQIGEANVYRNDLLTARTMFSEVFRRNTRNRRALRVMIALDIQKKDFKAAIRNLDILLRLKVNKKNKDEYHKVLLFLSENINASSIINDYLVDRPIWGHDHLLGQITSMTNNNFLKVGHSLEAFSTANSEYESDRKLRALYLKRLQIIGEVDAAYSYWLNLTQTPEADNYTVFNPDFDKREELPPFNWSLADKQEYFSEIDQGEGLYASYGDSEIGILTEQTIRLKVGQTYRFKVKAEWTYRKRQGMFFWNISCLPDQSIISSINLDETTKAQLGGYHDFQVPLKGCHVQSLRLSAKPGQYSQRIWSRTKSVNVTMLH